MKAIVLHNKGDANQLRYEEVETPKINDDEVIITPTNDINTKYRSLIIPFVSFVLLFMLKFSILCPYASNVFPYTTSQML